MLKNVPWSKLILAAASLALASLSYVFSVNFLKAKEAALTTALKQQYETKVQVIVAKESIEAGSFVTQDVLAVRDFPAAYLPADALTPDDFNRIQGLEIQWVVAPGRPLLQSYLGNPAAERFSETIPVGYRAITLSVNDMSSHENMIEVGDQVDLYRFDADTMHLLREQVQVIATGNVRSASTDPNGSLIGSEDSFDDYQSMTLLLPTDQIASVRLAEQEQSLLVLLRNPNDRMSVILDSVQSSPIESQVPFVSNRQSTGFIPTHNSAQAGAL